MCRSLEEDTLIDARQERPQLTTDVPQDFRYNLVRHLNPQTHPDDSVLRPQLELRSLPSNQANAETEQRLRMEAIITTLEQKLPPRKN
jgi:hypothetical protein